MQSDDTESILVPAAKPPHGNDPKQGGKRTGLTLTLLAIGLMVALAVGFFIVQRRRAAEQASLSEQSQSESSLAPSVDVVTVNYAPATESVGYPGEVRGWFESTIYARVNGYVAKWYVDIGDHVKTGQLLATIETPDLDAQLESARHQFAVSQSQVGVVKAQSDFAKSTYERWRDSPQGVVSQQEREEKKAEFNSSVAQLQAAMAKVSADQADVNSLAALEGYKYVTAPYDGVITSRHIDIGDLVTSGSTTGTSSLYTMAQIDRVRIFVDVPQRASAPMQVGTVAIANANNFPDQKFTGKISRTSSAIDPSTRTLHVEVDMDNPGEKLMPGLYLEVYFQLEHKGLLRVPSSALMFKPAGPQVAVVSDGKVNFHNVAIAIDNGDFVELGSGVTAGEQVALNLSNQVAEGDKVSATDVDGHAGAPQTASATQPSANGAMVANVPPSE